MAISGKTLESVIKPEQVRDFRCKIRNRCNEELYKAEGENWFPRECCPTHVAFDKRTPGLFKHEAEGSQMICLSSKTYVLQENDEKCKLSCKGVNKNAINNPMDIFTRVMEQKESIRIRNMTFRARNNYVWTQQQDKIGFLFQKRGFSRWNSHKSPRPSIKSVDRL